MHGKCDDELLPKRFDPLLQKKTMLEGELSRLSDRCEELKGALQLVNKYEKGLDDIHALLHPKIQGREGRVEVVIETV